MCIGLPSILRDFKSRNKAWLVKSDPTVTKGELINPELALIVTKLNAVGYLSACLSKSKPRQAKLQGSLNNSYIILVL